jgi:hypothetical protein
MILIELLLCLKIVIILCFCQNFSLEHSSIRGTLSNEIQHRAPMIGMIILLDLSLAKEETEG